MQAALFGPVKYGIPPELLREDELVAGNGIIEATTFLSIVIGTVAAGALILLDNGSLIVGAVGIALSLAGLLAAFAYPVGARSRPGIADAIRACCGRVPIMKAYPVNRIAELLPGKTSTHRSGHGILARIFSESSQFYSVGSRALGCKDPGKIGLLVSLNQYLRQIIQPIEGKLPALQIDPLVRNSRGRECGEPRECSTRSAPIVARPLDEVTAWACAIHVPTSWPMMSIPPAVARLANSRKWCRSRAAVSRS